MPRWDDFEILDPTNDLLAAVELGHGPWKRLVQEFCWENRVSPLVWWPENAEMYPGPHVPGMPFPELHASLGTRVYLLTDHQRTLIGVAATWRTAAKILARWDKGEIEGTPIEDADGQ